MFVELEIHFFSFWISLRIECQKLSNYNYQIQLNPTKYSFIHSKYTFPISNNNSWIVYLWHKKRISFHSIRNAWCLEQPGWQSNAAKRIRQSIFFVSKGSIIFGSPKAQSTLSMVACAKKIMKIGLWNSILMSFSSFHFQLALTRALGARTWALILHAFYISLCLRWSVASKGK